MLDLPTWGSTPAPKPRAIGSILPNAAAADGLNFESSAALEAYRIRRSRGWGVDPNRCERYMTSSQALTLNLLGPLAQDRVWLQAVLRSTVGTAPAKHGRFEIEFAPQHRHGRQLDRTIADAFVELEDGSALVIETKLADRFSTRNLLIATNPYYRHVNAQLELWDERATRFGDPRLDQLARVHALASVASDQAAQLLLVHHPADTVTPTIAREYQDTLVQGSQVVVVDLGRVIDHMLETATTDRSRSVAQRLYTRYIAHELSDELWLTHAASKTR